MRYLDKSVKYVNGENEAIILPQKGISSIDMKTPLIKTSGNLTSEESIIAVAGISVGG
jgi:hypothetical protein